MVFSSLPIYLNHSNWQQQEPIPQLVSTNESSQIQRSAPSPPQHAGTVRGSSGRLGSMVDRARMGKIPLPEGGLKCPRCESTNTKFCYYNNYSFSQERHYCKTCRRYWTRGGALRNVPPGGGCRRNKKKQAGGSKVSTSGTIAADRQSGPTIRSGGGSTTMPGHIAYPTTPQLSLMGALHDFTPYSAACHNNNDNNNNNGGFHESDMVGDGNSIQPADHIRFHFGSNVSAGNTNSLLSTDHWRPFFLTGFEPTPGFLPYQSEGVEGSSLVLGEPQLRPMTTSPGVTQQMAPVKMEDRHQGLVIPRQFLSISEGNNHQLGASSSWTEFIGRNTFLY